jgi:hypothetical protein
VKCSMCKFWDCGPFSDDISANYCRRHSPILNVLTFETCQTCGVVLPCQVHRLPPRPSTPETTTP